MESVEKSRKPEPSASVFIKDEAHGRSLQGGTPTVGALGDAALDKQVGYKPAFPSIMGI